MNDRGTQAGPQADAARLGAGSLVIDRIETIALRAPLGRRFSGSAYSMDNRCTIVVRLTTADGDHRRDLQRRHRR